jgi:hypothetical protein
MRLMLGSDNDPRLLVVTDDKNNYDKFAFWVINGRWNGVYDNGSITVEKSGVIHGWAVICDDQVRLSSKSDWDYAEVFKNFDDKDYAGPTMSPGQFDVDDDIPF